MLVHWTHATKRPRLRGLFRHAATKVTHTSTHNLHASRYRYTAGTRSISVTSLLVVRPTNERTNERTGQGSASTEPAIASRLALSVRYGAPACACYMHADSLTTRPCSRHDTHLHRRWRLYRRRRSRDWRTTPLRRRCRWSLRRRSPLLTH